MVTNNVIRHAKTVGMDIGDEGGDNEGSQPAPRVLGNHTITHNVVSDNGGSGIQGSFSTGRTGPGGGGEQFAVHGGVISFNRIERNNYLQCGAYESAGLKTHGFSGTVEGNLVQNNTAYSGVWFDTLWHHVRFTRNVVLNNGPFYGPGTNSWFANGVTFEIGLGPAVVDNNIIAGTAPGPGLIGIDANNVTAFGNLLFGNGGGCVLPHPQYHAAAPLAGMPNCGQLNIGLATPRDYGLESHGCSEALTTTNTTLKNWVVGGNMLVSDAAVPWGDLATFAWAEDTWKVWHPVCNITIADNVVVGKTSAYLRNYTGSRRNQHIHAAASWHIGADGDPVLRLSAEPAAFNVTPPRLEGSDVDFTGKRRAGPLTPGPFQSLQPGDTLHRLWPVAPRTVP